MLLRAACRQLIAEDRTAEFERYVDKHIFWRWLHYEDVDRNTKQELETVLSEHIPTLVPQQSVYPTSVASTTGEIRMMSIPAHATVEDVIHHIVYEFDTVLAVKNIVALEDPSRPGYYFNPAAKWYHYRTPEVTCLVNMHEESCNGCCVT